MVAFVWQHLEYMPNHKVFGHLLNEASFFEKKVAWCYVYSPEVHLAHIEECHLRLNHDLEMQAHPVALHRHFTDTDYDFLPPDLPADDDIIEEFPE